MITEYRSFEEIDAHLKILSLQRKIDKESLKLNLERAKTDLKFSKVFNGFIQIKIITWVTKRLVKLIRKD